MKILLTGATGYIGKRLLLQLVKDGHKIVCCVRDINRFTMPENMSDSIEIIQVDFLDESTLSNIPVDIEVAYYLIHSMSTHSDYNKWELISAQNFNFALSKTNVKHVIYLSGIVNEKSLSKHLASRKAVEEELSKGQYHLTTFRAGIIIGSGSASFEIIRDLVEKLPIMITPKWLNTKCQPIAISDVIKFLNKSILVESTFDQSFDIGGPNILTYKEMLLGFAEIRGLKRWIFTIPVMTPKISSYWLYFITATSFKLASALVSSMKIEVICRESEINQILSINPISYHSALKQTMSDIDSDHIISSWKDSLISGRFEHNLTEYINVPNFGCYKDERKIEILDRKITLEKIWSIGGENGWYYAKWLWIFRGFLDKIAGGVGLRRGRTHLHEIAAGDSIDFWRVLIANKNEGRLLLFAEMKLPGEAWLEFKIINNVLYQTATFRPKGLLGRLYWYSVLPFHSIIFKGMIKELA
jgi:uncharacterized protein YbjT (DUF2867 family)